MDTMKRYSLLLALVAGIGTGVVVTKYMEMQRAGAEANEAEEAREKLAAVQGTTDAFAKAFALVAKAVSPSVVHINARSAPQLFDEWDIFQPYRNQDQIGSGVVVAKDGYILTNNHVVANARSITVTFADGRIENGEVVGSDENIDLAVVRVKADGLTPIPMGDSDAIEVGNWVVAIGNPYGLDHTVTTGIVSAMGRAKESLTGYEGYIQTDAAINPGNSGGPLVNLNGELIGVNTMIYSRTGGYQGIGFAIPSKTAKLVMDRLIADGKLTYGYLGVKVYDITTDLAAWVNRTYGTRYRTLAEFVKDLGLDEPRGAFVTGLYKKSPAADGGVAEGDIVLEFNGHAIQNARHLINLVSFTEPETKATIKVLREKRELSLEVVVKPRPGK
ncbi:MAG: trypsin-like peptidase domain-containing protein [Planctomycetota bacterium]